MNHETVTPDMLRGECCAMFVYFDIKPGEDREKAMRGVAQEGIFPNDGKTDMHGSYVFVTWLDSESVISGINDDFSFYSPKARKRIFPGQNTHTMIDDTGCYLLLNGKELFASGGLCYDHTAKAFFLNMPVMPRWIGAIVDRNTGDLRICNSDFVQDIMHDRLPKMTEYSKELENNGIEPVWPTLTSW